VGQEYSPNGLLPITVTIVTVIRRRLCLRRFFILIREKRNKEGIDSMVIAAG